jgi:hypothetical protein
MAASVNNLMEKALILTPAQRADLAKKLIESIEVDIDPAIERSYLEEVKRRMLDVDSGKSVLVNGEDVLERMRALIQIKNVFEEGELRSDGTVAKSATVQTKAENS